MEYTIVEGKKANVERSVNGLMRTGWTPLGRPTIVVVEKIAYVYQALVRVVESTT